MARWKNGYACRCRRRGCEARKTLRLHPDGYWGANKRHARCHCGGELRVDWYRSSGVEAKNTACGCQGYPFFHRRGSLFCRFGGAGDANGYGYPAEASFAAWDMAGRPPQPAPVVVPRDEPPQYDYAHLAEDVGF